MRHKRILGIIALLVGIQLLAGCSRVPSEKRVSRVVTRTIDGEPWSLADHKGKVVLIDFWATWCGPCRNWEDWLKEQHARFGSRKDFVMVGVALDETAAPVRAYCKTHGMTWQQLHEPDKVWKNSLFRAFKGRGVPYVWLIRKDGSMEELDDGHGQVEGALLGFTYESCDDMLAKINKGRFDQKMVRSLCGPPDSYTKTGAGETWRYVRKSRDRAQVVEVQIRFDDKGLVHGWQCSRRILEPAILTVVIGEEYWKKHITPRIPRGQQPAKGGRYSLLLAASQGNTSYLFDWPGEEPLAPGKAYTLQLVGGTYDISAYLRDETSGRRIKEFPLKEGLLLAKNERRELRF